MEPKVYSYVTMCKLSQPDLHLSFEWSASFLFFQTNSQHTLLGADTAGVWCASRHGTTTLLELLNISFKIVALRFVSYYLFVLFVFKRLLFISRCLVATWPLA